jgi:hypothetical protein
MNAPHFSRHIGVLSIGLGLIEVLLPRKVTQAVGVSANHDSLVRTMGAGKIGIGLALLAQPKPTGWMWSRVAADLVDLTLLSAALSGLSAQPLRVSRSSDSDRRRLATAIGGVAALAVVNLVVSAQLTRKPRPDPRWRYIPAGGRAGIARKLNPTTPPPLEYPSPENRNFSVRN